VRNVIDLAIRNPEITEHISYIEALWLVMVVYALIHNTYFAYRSYQRLQTTRAEPAPLSIQIAAEGILWRDILRFLAQVGFGWVAYRALIFPNPHYLTLEGIGFTVAFLFSEFLVVTNAVIDAFYMKRVADQYGREQAAARNMRAKAGQTHGA